MINIVISQFTVINSNIPWYFSPCVQVGMSQVAVLYFSHCNVAQTSLHMYVVFNYSHAPSGIANATVLKPQSRAIGWRSVVVQGCFNTAVRVISSEFGAKSSLASLTEFINLQNASHFVFPQYVQLERNYESWKICAINLNHLNLLW